MIQISTPIITIDGPAASGKGTIARRIADALGYAYIDTGAFYRLVGKACLDQSISLDDETSVTRVTKELSSKITLADFGDPAIRSEAVGQAASKVAPYPTMRAALLDTQRQLAKNPPLLLSGEAAKGTVFDGRDTGTVVCPDADFKFFITAETAIRAERRTKELQSKGIQCSYDAVLQDMLQRDKRDSGRDTAPMTPAEDAEVIDTSSMTADQVFETVLAAIKA
jgi:cytidylate kinase